MKAESLRMLDKVCFLYKTYFLCLLKSRLESMHPVFISINSYFEA